MSRIRFEIARQEDDQALRELLAQTPIPGPVSVSFCREPSYFATTAMEGPFHQTIVAREAGRIVAMGSRSVRRRYVNGRATSIGYLGSLRLLPSYRGTSVLARGYRFLRELHRDGRTSLYLTTITEGNDQATALLTSGRGPLPKYRDAGRYHTLCIPVARICHRQDHGSHGLSLRPAVREDMAAIIDFLSDVGPGRQFFAEYAPEDFIGQPRTFHGLEPADLLLAFDQGVLTGTLAIWDQRRSRQTTVVAYNNYLSWARPFYNCWARAKRIPILPASGHPFPFITAAIPVVRNDDAEIFRSLLRQLGAHVANRAEARNTYLLVGLHECDTLLPVAQAYATQDYCTRLYYVCWNDGNDLLAELDNRSPYLELGCL